MQTLQIFHLAKTITCELLFLAIFVSLKKLIAISFLFIFLVTNTEMYQLLKLPVLFHHYLEHSKEEGSRSFADFLHDHYSAEDSYPSPGNDEHGKLPFKSHDCGMANGFFAYYAAEAFMVKAEIPFSAKEEVFVYDVAFNSSSHLAKIWQPPKSC